MDAKNKLLDKARAKCSPATDSALAERMGIHRATLSRFRTGRDPMPEDRVSQLAAIAGEDTALWLVLVHAEQSTGATHRAWEKLAQRLGWAAALALTLTTLPALPAKAADGHTVGIMRSGRRRVMTASTLLRGWFLSLRSAYESSIRCPRPALLAAVV